MKKLTEVKIKKRIEEMYKSPLEVCDLGSCQYSSIQFYYELMQELHEEGKTPEEILKMFVEFKGTLKHKISNLENLKIVFFDEELETIKNEISHLNEHSIELTTETIRDWGDNIRVIEEIKDVPSLMEAQRELSCDLWSAYIGVSSNIHKFDLKDKVEMQNMENFKIAFEIFLAIEIYEVATLADYAGFDT